MYTPDSDDVVTYLANHGQGSPLALARAAMDVAFVHSADINLAKKTDAYVLLLNTLRQMVTKLWRDPWHRSTPLEIRNLLSEAVEDLPGLQSLDLASQSQITKAGLAIACLQTLEECCLDTICNDFLTDERHEQDKDHLDVGDILVAPDPEMMTRANGKKILNHPITQCEPHETLRLRRYRGDPDDLTIVWRKEQSTSLTALLGYNAKTGNPKMATGTPVD